MGRSDRSPPLVQNRHRNLHLLHLIVWPLRIGRMADSLQVSSGHRRRLYQYLRRCPSRGCIPAPLPWPGSGYVSLSRLPWTGRRAFCRRPPHPVPGLAVHLLPLCIPGKCDHLSGLSLPGPGGNSSRPGQKNQCTGYIFLHGWFSGYRLWLFRYPRNQGMDPDGWGRTPACPVLDERKEILHSPH